MKRFLTTMLVTGAVLGGGVALLDTGTSGTVLWKADAENSIITPATTGEWASRSCKFEERIKQGTVGPQGARSYRIELRDGETPNNAERCELAQANTSSSNIASHKLFASGQTYYIAEQVYLQSPWAFSSSCGGDGWACGGLVNQFKQTGSCGVPAGGISANTDGFHYRVSANNLCSGANFSKSAFRWPLVEGRWLKILIRLTIDADPGEGSIELWYDNTGKASWNPTQAVPNASGIQGARVEGSVLRTHTTKRDDTLSKCPANPCAHARIGIYRDERIQGTSVLRVDGFTVATTPEAAIENAIAP